MAFALPSLLSRSMREALSDFRQRWKIGIACLGILLWLYFLIGGITALADPDFSGSSESIAQSGAACRPDDSFSPLPISESWSQWDGSGFFQITLGFGTLDFNAVKAIDVAWDIVSTKAAWSKLLRSNRWSSRLLAEAGKLLLR